MAFLSPRNVTGLAVVAFALTAASAQATSIPIDPVGFCPPPATAAACTAPTGMGGETISVGATSIGMFKNGNGGTAVSPWDLLVAVPDNIGGAPVITFASVFTPGTVDDEGQFLPTTKGDIYNFADGLKGDGSINVSNMFGPNEQAAFGGALPAFFEVYAYSFTPAIADNTAYVINVGGAGLPAGTWLAAYGGDNPFTTPNTTAGLVNGPDCTTGTCIVHTEGSPVPEPASLLLLGTGLAVVARRVRRRR